MHVDGWKLMGDEVLVVFLRLVCKSNAVRCCHHLLCLLWLGLVMLWSENLKSLSDIRLCKQGATSSRQSPKPDNSISSSRRSVSWSLEHIDVQVTQSLNRLYIKFIKRNPNFDGKVCILPHHCCTCLLNYSFLFHVIILSWPSLLGVS